MKYHLLSLIGLFCSVCCLAQEKDRRNELSFNVTNFIGNYVNFGSAPSTNNPFLIGYRRFFNNSAFRAGINYRYDYSNTRVNPQQPRNYQKQSNLNLRAGYEWRQQLSKRWVWFAGLDATIQRNLFENMNNQRLFDGSKMVDVKQISKTIVTQYGGGPITGVQWKISKRIGLLTEARAYLTYTENTRNTEWEGVTPALRQRIGPSLDNTKNTAFFTNMVLNLPLDLFITFTF